MGDVKIRANEEIIRVQQNWGRQLDTSPFDFFISTLDAFKALEQEAPCGLEICGDHIISELSTCIILYLLFVKAEKVSSVK